MVTKPKYEYITELEQRYFEGRGFWREMGGYLATLVIMAFICGLVL